MGHDLPDYAKNVQIQVRGEFIEPNDDEDQTDPEIATIRYTFKE